MTASGLVGVDVGGTFTDLFFIDGETGSFRTAKTPSNRGDEAVGFIAGLETFGAITEIASIVHGTTVGTNALLERKGAPVGVITSAGFRDILEMRRRDRRKTWGLWGDFTPIVPRDMRIEVAERTHADGSVVTPVDAAEIEAACRLLIAQGAQALAIIFVNAYANGANERATFEIARRLWPNDHVAASSHILPEIREFERASTTALNATLQPVVGSYLSRLEDALAARQFAGTFHIVQSNGGIMSTQAARHFPVRTALSGPAAGVIAAVAIAKAAGFDNVITADLGGTSFDVSLITDASAAMAAQTTIDFGLVIRTPMIEITTIGAGGGSIARVDAGGLLQVGPESAGSRPGPVCYGQGNTRPTLTDANVVLGRINAARPIGGALVALDVEAAKSAIAAHVGGPLGLDPMHAAEAIVRVANARMAGAIRLVSIERGHDPGDFAAVPFGGGGALHVGALIADVGLKAALVPRFPGVTSALGCVMADIRHDAVRTINVALEGIDGGWLSRLFADDASAARAVVERAGLPMTQIDMQFALDAHYQGQTHTVAVALPPMIDDRQPIVDEAIVRAAFERAYLASFSRLLPGIPVRLVNLRVAALGRRPEFDLARLAPPRDNRIETAARAARPVWFDGGWQQAAVFARLELPTGAVILGPAVLEQPDATVLVDPGLAARVDPFGNVIVAAV